MPADQLATTALFQFTFITFFVSAGVAIYFRDRWYARQTFVAGLLAALLILGFVGLAPLPLVELHKFSNEGPEEGYFHQVYVVDESGNELQYDVRATKPILNSRLSTYALNMVREYDEQERQESAAFLLTEAQQYRSNVANGRSPMQSLSFPRHEINYDWHNRDLSQYSEFVGIRIYLVEYSTSDDGTEVQSQSKELVYEYSQEQST
ncbi:hypothetical protein ACODNH_05380 [Haloarcula sp. NS06]|uniref:hypothetical protein n=1 Tax=Haloarcula sp. NS06 TaxID=3409688 RepID=UPI003DA79AB4